MNFSPENSTEKLNSALNEENELLNAENEALTESITSVYYQSYVAKKDIEKEAGRLNEAEKELDAKEREIIRLSKSNRELSQALREARDGIKETNGAIAVLKKRTRIRAIIIVVFALLLVASVASSVMLLRRNEVYGSIISELRETSHRTPELVSDELRYRFEDAFHENW